LKLKRARRHSRTGLSEVRRAVFTLIGGPSSPFTPSGGEGALIGAAHLNRGERPGRDSRLDNSGRTELLDTVNTATGGATTAERAGEEARKQACFQMGDPPLVPGESGGGAGPPSGGDAHLRSLSGQGGERAHSTPSPATDEVRLVYKDMHPKQAQIGLHTLAVQLSN
jgi:hypothetical protein